MPRTRRLATGLAVLLTTSLLTACGGDDEDALVVYTAQHEQRLVEVVGAFPNYAEAKKAWKARAQATVDNAHMRYFILHAHRLIDPRGDAH